MAKRLMPVETGESPAACSFVIEEGRKPLEARLKRRSRGSLVEKKRGRGRRSEKKRGRAKSREEEDRKADEIDETQSDSVWFRGRTFTGTHTFLSYHSHR